jgi:hypothetical protein
VGTRSQAAAAIDGRSLAQRLALLQRVELEADGNFLAIDAVDAGGIESRRRFRTDLPQVLGKRAWQHHQVLAEYKTPDLPFYCSDFKTHCSHLQELIVRRRVLTRHCSGVDCQADDRANDDDTKPRNSLPVSLKVTSIIPIGQQVLQEFAALEAVRAGIGAKARA